MSGPIVEDKEYQAAASMISTALTQLNELFSKYSSALNLATSNEIVVGKAGNALKRYADLAKSVQSTISSIGETHQQECQRFLSEVEAADQIQM